MSGSAQPLRVGCVKYLNAQPLIFGWSGEVVFAHPAELCRDLADGKLDVAFVSSFEFLRNPIYSVVDDVAVVSPGPVHSVFLAHTAPLEEVQEIVLDPASRTSVNLLRCLLAERGLSPRFVSKSEAIGEAGRERAELMIGDQALSFRAAHEHDQRFWDLATAWRELIALPFVFALWLIRPDVENAAEIAAGLRRLRDTNLQRLEDVIAAQSGFTPEFCAFYFRDCLRFFFADAEKAGLLRFRALCEKHGILPPQETRLRLA